MAWLEDVEGGRAVRAARGVGVGTVLGHMGAWNVTLIRASDVSTVPVQQDILVASIGDVNNTALPEVMMAGNIHGDETTGGQLLQRWMWATCNAPTDLQVTGDTCCVRGGPPTAPLFSRAALPLHCRVAGGRHQPCGR